MAPVSPTDAERRKTCLWLAHVASWRGGSVGRLCTAFGGLEQVLEQPRDTLAESIARSGRVRRRQGRRPGGADAEEQRLDNAFASAALAGGTPPPAPPLPGAAAVTFVDRLYPARLTHLHDPPPALFVVGRRARAALAALSCRTLVAVVGSRAPSPYGAEMTAAIAGGLAEAGVVVVSGLALGVDALAHRAAADAARALPSTLAVLGCGADVCYPRTNRGLYERIVQDGLVVSEFVWGVPARSWRFPSRNRIMAGLSDALVVVEGSGRSGSLITAEFMLDIGRPVLAVPGEAGRRLSEGPHKLLRDGARICESAADVLAALEREPLEQPDHIAAGEAVERHEAALVSALDDAERSVDELASLLAADAAHTLAILTRLELEGRVQTSPGGRYRLVRGKRAR